MFVKTYPAQILASLELYGASNQKGKEVEKIDLPEEIFEVPMVI